MTGSFRGHDSSVRVSQQKVATSNASPNSTANVTIPGLSITIEVLSANEVWMVEMTADVRTVTASGTCIVELLVDGAAVTPTLATANSPLMMATRTWRITGLSVGSHTFSARTRMGAVSTSANIVAATTSMLVEPGV